MVIEEQLPLKEFETWLYDQHDLSEMMSNDLILSLYSFNYNQQDAQYEFKSTFLKYFDRQEFMLWKVKANLSDLIEGKGKRDRILYEFNRLGYEECPFLRNIGYYMYYLEDIKYYGNGTDAALEDLKQDASLLLKNIKEQENNIPGFKISEFRQVES